MREAKILLSRPPRAYLMRSAFYMHKDIPVLFAVKHSTFFEVLLKYPPQKVQSHAPFQ